MPVPSKAGNTTSGKGVQRATVRKPAERGDFTAMQVQALEVERDTREAEKVQEEQARSAHEARVRKTEVVDYTGADVPLPEPELDDVELSDPYRTITIKVGIEEMVYGREIIKQPQYNEEGELTKAAILGGLRTLSFEEGRKYRVPRELAKHLDERGFVFH